MPQFGHPETYLFRVEHLADGLSLFSFGLAKKVILADNLSPASRYVFDQLSAGHVPLGLAWFGALSYTFQIYFDFSGYSDMAIGLARMFNVQFPLNFNSPYQALDISDFWRRWHITLSHFLRDHLYIPLGGNRKGEPRRYANLMCTMLLGGLWHGAAWTFVIWGGLHGLYLVIHRFWQIAIKDVGWMQSRSMLLLGQAVTFLAVVAAWVFFRAHSFSQATGILAGMIGLHGLGLPSSFIPVVQPMGLDHASFAGWDLPDLSTDVLMLIVSAAIAFFVPNNHQIFHLAETETSVERPSLSIRLWKNSTLWALATGLVLSIDIQHLNTLSEFLYFKF